MPRITSLNILLEAEGKDYLSELYRRVIENVQRAFFRVLPSGRADAESAAGAVSTTS